MQVWFLLLIHADFQILNSLDFKNQGTAVVVWERTGLLQKVEIPKLLSEIWNQLAGEKKYRWMSAHKHRQTNRQTDCWRPMTLSVCVCVCDGAPVCVSFQSVRASVPLIILIWLCLLLSCLVGDKAEGPSPAHSLALYYRAGWATQDWSQLTCSQAISLQEETRGRGNCKGTENNWREGNVD